MQKRIVLNMTQDNADKKMEIRFAPGCFDNFEGTQEELDEMIAEIERMVADGSFMENSEPLDLDALAEEDPEMAELTKGLQRSQVDSPNASQVLCFVHTPPVDFSLTETVGLICCYLT